VFDEFRRAVAAERRHSELKHMDTTALVREGITRTDVPRRVFEEYYSSTESERAGTGALHQRARSCLTSSPSFSVGKSNNLGYRGTAQQQVPDLAWRRVLVAAIYRLLQTSRALDALRSCVKFGLSETSGAELGTLR
jgi:hypothetical protein